jgi:thiamine kinase-like enzyme
MAMDEVAAALARIPMLSGVPRAEVGAERLGGLTNRNYKLTVGSERYVLRIAGDGTSAYIDREVEAHNARVASRAGVNAEVLHFDTVDGLMLCRYLDGCTTMSPARFREAAGAPARAARALKRMHSWPEPFRFRFELFAMIDGYLKVLGTRDVGLPDGYHEAVRDAGTVRAALDARPAPLAPCHCDPLTENFLDDGRRMWVVDWEYSGMNDPLWDLGDLSVEAGFGAAEDAEMMAAYCGAPPTTAEMGRMVIYKAMCDLLWTLWGLIQLADGNPTDDFQAYAATRFERCTALMAEASFGRHLEAVKAG